MNGCEYCSGESLSSKPLSVMAGFRVPLESIVDDCFLYNYCECGRKTVTKIKYCPMCGRKLLEDE